MFVSNHNSWMDIPFIGYAMGWVNYKFVAKKELEKVPILGFSLSVAKHMMIDRADRKSQLLTLRQGMKYMDDGVNLVTFPEGTRSRSGRVMPFKNGAFKVRPESSRARILFFCFNARSNERTKMVLFRWRIKRESRSCQFRSAMRPRSCRHTG